MIWTKLTTQSLIFTITLLIFSVMTQRWTEAGLVNLLTNGDFELGNTGFLSDHRYIPNPQLIWPGEYAIDTNPSAYNRESFSFGDHTTGSGLMMIVDAQTNVRVWSQTVSVTPGTSYDFNGWIASPFVGEPKYASAYIQATVNGELIGSTYSPTPSATWHQFNFSWNANLATSATIEIFERRDIGHPGDVRGGSDFALDDLSFQISAVPEPSALCLCGIASLIAAFSRARCRRNP